MCALPCELTGFPIEITADPGFQVTPGSVAVLTCSPGYMPIWNAETGAAGPDRAESRLFQKKLSLKLCMQRETSLGL